MGTLCCNPVALPGYSGSRWSATTWWAESLSICPVIPCRAIEAAADGCSDVVGMAYWWSNCIQLRWMLWAMCHGGGMGDEGGNDAEATGDEFGWVMQASAPAGQWPHLPFGCLWCIV